MFSFGKTQNEYTLHENYFKNNVVDNVQELLTNDSDVILSIDNLIDNTISFYTSKIDFLKIVPNTNQPSKQIYNEDNKNDIHFLLSMGLLDIESNNVTDNKNHIQLKDLDSSKLKQNASTITYINFVQEYISKLDTLKNISIENEKLPENTSFHFELKNKLSLFLKKTKYFIFDIYMNHYIQFVYLLFAVNIIDTSEVYFKLNAEQQKQLAVLKKVDALVKEYSIDKTKDLSKITKLQESYEKLIKNFTDLPRYNKPTKQEEDRLKTPVVSGGTGVEKDFTVISTIADELINNLLEKHKYFYEMYVSTREALPDYFETINGLVMDKIEKLKSLRNDIINLESEDVALITNLTTKIPANNLDNTDIMSKPHFKELIENLKNDISTKIKQTSEFATGLNQSMSTEQTVPSFDQSSIPQQPQDQSSIPQQPQPQPQPQPQAQNPFAAMNGGFIRGSTRQTRKPKIIK